MVKSLTASELGTRFLGLHPAPELMFTHCALVCIESGTQYYTCPKMEERTLGDDRGEVMEQGI